MPQKVTLSEKDLSLLKDLLTYEQWAARNSQMYRSMLTEGDSGALCKTLEDNHTKNFNDLYNFVKSH